MGRARWVRSFPELLDAAAVAGRGQFHVAPKAPLPDTGGGGRGETILGQSLSVRVPLCFAQLTTALCTVMYCIKFIIPHTNLSSSSNEQTILCLYCAILSLRNQESRYSIQYSLSGVCSHIVYYVPQSSLGLGLLHLSSRLSFVFEIIGGWPPLCMTASCSSSPRALPRGVA